MQLTYSSGDSYSQTGFNINGEAPSASNPLGNPPLPGWTASGGINWVGSLATEFNSSLTLAYNFAYGGATVDADIVVPYIDTVVCMDDQVKIFLDFIDKQPKNVPWTKSNALVGVWIGVNDVGNSYYRENSTDILKKDVARYFELLQQLYDAGLRKFALLSVPPTNLTPLMLQQDAASNGLLVSSIKLYNKLLSSGFHSFQAANRDITAKIIDTSLAFNRAIKNPKAYGAPNATCYNEDGVSCLWFNDYHPGIAIERLVASDVGKVVNKRPFKW
ncbi:hypothetical protein BGZ61DRAFT_357815 [Ilyonectria robusta]|uniref:uncharacterized protein n=1 Tax=Ilyonectria robusta TaxID=1079257 RepID=UPI001E8E0CF9|nr:uncharacterized protein BGZ61DRAFT_357815 [Ilyonectria robusta]KAH8683699.1 hypothetical protein BGZ61DRAFT_357815 [Ilyonectria robusta]